MPLVVPAVLHNEMNTILHYSVLLLLPTLVLVHLYWSPYTKVEESFNIQAAHDILVHGIPFEDAETKLAANYDHVSFPGSVPRTFIGALLLAECARPWTQWLTEPQHAQLLIRAILGLGNSIALLLFRRAVNQAFGRTAAFWYILLQASQFHVIYYASRTLPNMFAFILTTFAQRNIILSSFGPRKRRARRCQIALCLLTVAGIIFRSEIAALLATQTAHLYLVRRFSLKHVIIPAGIASMAVSILATVTVDSFFWQKFPLWPEWVAFRYNAIEGHSSQWGTSPFYFYFVNSLPRLLLNPMSFSVCTAIAILEKSTRRFSFDMLAPLVAYVGVLSFLPHKEWRFIIYVIPGITAVSSSGASLIWSRRAKSMLFKILAAGLVVSVLLSFTASFALLFISSYNYPGAEALNKLHELADGERPLIRVHLDNLSCQTGVSRFLEKPKPSGRRNLNGTTVWNYNKTEDPQQLVSPLFWERFDYALTENPKHLLGNWDTVDTAYGYAGITMFPEGPVATKHPRNEHGKWWSTVDRMQMYMQTVESWVRKHVTNGRWLGIRMAPKIYIMKKQEM